MSRGNDSPQANEKTRSAFQRLCSKVENFVREKMLIGITATILKRSGGCIRNLVLSVSCVASTLQTCDYFLPLSQKPPETAKGWEQSTVNVKDNVIENELSRVVGFVS